MSGGDLFESSAANFARGVDRLIASGAYRRGAVFLEALRGRLSAGSRVLDYGCGPGRLAHLLARHGFLVEGVDPSEAMIREAQAQRPLGDRLRFRVLGAPPAGIALEYYDGIVCSSVLEYVSDDIGLLTRFRSWLRPGGVALVTFANLRSAWRVYARLHSGHGKGHFARQRHVEGAPSFRSKVVAAGLQPEGPVVYFESPLDRWPLLRSLAGLSCVGTLGLVAARRTGVPGPS